MKKETIIIAMMALMLLISTTVIVSAATTTCMIDGKESTNCGFTNPNENKPTPTITYKTNTPELSNNPNDYGTTDKTPTSLPDDISSYGTKKTPPPTPQKPWADSSKGIFNSWAGTAGFLSGLSTGLSGYSWQSYLYDPGEEASLLGGADSWFAKNVLNLEDSFMSKVCDSPSSNSDDTRVIVGGSAGGNAGGWMASEYVPYVYYNLTTKPITNQTGRIYKISAEFVPGTCTKMQLTLSFNDGTPIITDSETGNAYTYKMGSDYPESSGGVSSVSFTGSEMIMKFSTRAYSKTCVTFTELSDGCLSNDVDINHQYCWNIQSSSEVYSNSGMLDRVGSADTGSGDDPEGSGSGTSGPTTGGW